ncbi:uncharacterized protein LOC143854547 isoform X2 [Tasmannia lanceolata]|uniref:uncharacterized protein LOC143854547 isoform X2 n=1 Tax=Tasmannia lanceolata TaxID=3420 RepID=UPI004062DBCD
MASGDNPLHIVDEGYFYYEDEYLEGEDEDEEEDEEDEEDEDYVPLVRNPPPGFAHPVQDGDEEGQVGRGGDGNGDSVAGSSQKRAPDSDSIVGSSQKRMAIATVDGKNSDIASCPICMEPWSSQGPHRICSLLCGHLYGRYCIEKWIRQCKRNIGKCPQCNEKCNLKDIIDIYAPQVAVVDDDLHKEVISLRNENEFLKMENASLLKEVRLHKKRLMDGELSEKQAGCFEHVSLAGRRRMPSEFADDRRGSVESYFLDDSFGSQNSGRRGSSRCSFVLKDELEVDGARIFDMDSSSQIMIMSRRLPGMDGAHVLTKISLRFPYVNENISLPSSYRAVRDIRISHNPGRLALFASMGKKLSIFSTENNNIVLTYDLPGPAWSCSWDFHSPQHVYAGLQNGMLIGFDLRQTSRPMESISGLTSHPVHTIHSLVDNGVHSLPYAVRTILSASSTGPCQWNIGVGERMAC